MASRLDQGRASGAQRTVLPTAAWGELRATSPATDLAGGTAVVPKARPPCVTLTRSSLVSPLFPPPRPTLLPKKHFSFVTTTYPIPYLGTRRTITNLSPLAVLRLLFGSYHFFSLPPPPCDIPSLSLFSKPTPPHAAADLYDTLPRVPTLVFRTVNITTISPLFCSPTSKTYTYSAGQARTSPNPAIDCRTGAGLLPLRAVRYRIPFEPYTTTDKIDMGKS